MSPEKKRRAELNGVGGDVKNVRVSGTLITGRIVFNTAADAQKAAKRLRDQGWGASVDQFTVRALVVLA